MKNGSSSKNGIDRRVIENILNYGGAGTVSIKQRLDHLRKEWDMDRALELNSAIMSIAGLALGQMINKNFYVIPVILGFVLMQQALQKWNPLTPLLRKLGFRTRSEIDAEQYALKAVNGEFGEPVSAYQAVQALKN